MNAAIERLVGKRVAASAVCVGYVRGIGPCLVCGGKIGRIDDNGRVALACRFIDVGVSSIGEVRRLFVVLFLLNRPPKIVIAVRQSGLVGQLIIL